MDKQAVPRFIIRHRHTADPDAYEEALQQWAALLADRLRQQFMGQQKTNRRVR